MTLVLVLVIVDFADEDRKPVTTFPIYVSMTVRVLCVYMCATVFAHSNDTCKCLCVMYIIIIRLLRLRHSKRSGLVTMT